MFFPWILCVILAIAVIALCLKILSMKRGLSEILKGLTERLDADTNTLLTLSSGDKNVARLAAELNKELRLLREQRHRYLHGDREVKDAVTNISHDLRTPLTAIRGYLDLLEREDLTGDVRRYLDLIDDRVQAMVRLTEELFQYSLTLSASEPLALVPLDLDAVLEESLASFYEPLTEAGIVPDIHLCKGPCMIMADKSSLLRVFSNILHNALKYSDGDLTVLLSPEGKVTFSNAAHDLDKIEVGKLFDRFFTVETGRRSTGLGLAIAKDLMEKMGGTISATYQDGRLIMCLVFPIIGISEQNS